MNPSKKLYLGIIVVVLAFSYLMFTGFDNSTAYYLTIDEALASSQGDNYLRVAGKLDGQSVQWDAQKIQLSFKIRSEETGKSVEVVYKGVKPDNFTHDVEIIVEGNLSDEKVFLADKLLVKCPSKYEEEKGR